MSKIQNHRPIVNIMQKMEFEQIKLKVGANWTTISRFFQIHLQRVVNFSSSDTHWHHNQITKQTTTKKPTIFLLLHRKVEINKKLTRSMLQRRKAELHKITITHRFGNSSHHGATTSSSKTASSNTPLNLNNRAKDLGFTPAQTLPTFSLRLRRITSETFRNSAGVETRRICGR